MAAAATSRRKGGLIAQSTTPCMQRAAAAAGQAGQAGQCRVVSDGGRPIVGRAGRVAKPPPVLCAKQKQASA